MHGNDLRAGILEHLRILQALVVIIKDTHLGRDWYVAVSVRCVDELVDQIHVIHQK